MRKINSMFAVFATWSTKMAGSSIFFIILIISTMIWLMIGPFVQFSDSWQIFCNTVSTIITTLLVVLIQYTQNRESRAIQIKLDELIRSKQHADNKLINIETLSDEQLEEIHKRYLKIAEEINTP